MSPTKWGDHVDGHEQQTNFESSQATPPPLVIYTLYTRMLHPAGYLKFPSGIVYTACCRLFFFVLLRTNASRYQRYSREYSRAYIMFFLFERSEFLIATSPPKSLRVCACVRLILVLVWDTRVFDSLWF